MCDQYSLLFGAVMQPNATAQSFPMEDVIVPLCYWSFILIVFRIKTMP